MSSVDDELRPVTVLFADVVGSTALGERLPPDEVKALIGECVSQMSRAVNEYGGTVQAYMGDGICAYFGVPSASEDDPERAARAALRILEVVGEYARDIDRAWGIDTFDVRIGIDAGQAAVGLVGVDPPERIAFGDANNVAARLQQLAAPGTIAVGEAAARRLEHRFDLEPLGRLPIRGRVEEVLARRLLGPAGAAESRSSVPLIGREVEIAQLRAVVEELATGRGQILMLGGEAGIGKTRLLDELRELAGPDVTWLDGNCLSYGGLPLWPFEQMLRGWLDLGDGDPEIAMRTKARARLGPLLGGELRAALSGLGRLLRVRLDPEADNVSSTPAHDVGTIERACRAWIHALATRPVIVAVEDLHWASPEAGTLAESLLPLTDQAAVLLVVTMRADPTSVAWRFRLRALGDYAHRTRELRLEPLRADAAGELVRMLSTGLLDEETAASVVERSEGNPLFVEELVRLLLEGGRLERRRTWTLTVGPTALPARLESLLVARMDALPESARRIAQMAAVIGRRFDVLVLEHVAGIERTSPDLLALIRAEIVREVRRYPDLECEFRHGLLHEAALSTLTPTRHRELAGRVAAAFEELLGTRATDDAERLAQYYVRSDRLDKAVVYLELAAFSALAAERPAHAAALLETAGRAATRLGDDQSVRRLEQARAALELQGLPAPSSA
jgi:class 3 adenylate cyclase